MYNIKSYREQVLEYLKQTKNHYSTKRINLQRLNKSFEYFRWLHPYQGDWEVDYLFTEEILKNYSRIIKPSSTVIDIGAQTGNMSVAYSLFAKQVFSFEPNPATYEVLEKNSTVNPNIKPYNYAISDEEGELEFHYSDPGFCNGGFATRTQHGVGVTGHVIPIDVYAINLVKFFDEEKIDTGDISLIKIDAEGHDKDILKTLKPLIDKHKPYLISEIYNGLSKEETQELIDIIHSYGYKVYDEEVNKCNLDNLGLEIKSSNDIKPGSGHNLFCVL